MTMATSGESSGPNEEVRSGIEAVKRDAPGAEIVDLTGEEVLTVGYDSAPSVDLLTALYPAAFAAAEARGYRRGREEAAEAIVAHRDKFWPADDRLNSARAAVRRHLTIAVQVASPDRSLAEVAQTFKAYLEATEPTP